MANLFSPQNLAALDAKEPYDVCIMGSGPAGSVIATSLARQGVRTILLESGTGLMQWLVDPKLKQLASYDFSGNTDYPLTKTKARLLGGNSNFWTGRCERLHPSDFEVHPYSPPDNPWPITYSDLDPYYEKAEKTLRVRGSVRSSSAPPRDESKPLLESGLDNSYLKDLFGKVGVTVDDSPTATPTKTFRFFNVQKEILPEYLEYPNTGHVTGVTVTKLDTDATKKVTSAQVHTLDGIKKLFEPSFTSLLVAG